MKYEKIWGSYYGDMTIGVTRWYTAQQHGDRPDYLVRVQRVYTLKTGTDKIILQPFGWQDNGGAYRIVQIQQVMDDDDLPATDLTLERDDGIDVGDITGSAGSTD